jgi:hypothetical protein
LTTTLPDALAISIADNTTITDIGTAGIPVEVLIDVEITDSAVYNVTITDSEVYQVGLAESVLYQVATAEASRTS